MTVQTTIRMMSTTASAPPGRGVDLHVALELGRDLQREQRVVVHDDGEGGRVRGQGVEKSTERVPRMDGMRLGITILNQ